VAKVDGGIVASEDDLIHVGGETAPIPEPGTMLLFSISAGAFAFSARKRPLR